MVEATKWTRIQLPLGPQRPHQEPLHLPPLLQVQSHRRRRRRWSRQQPIRLMTRTSTFAVLTNASTPVSALLFLSSVKKLWSCFCFYKLYFFFCFYYFLFNFSAMSTVVVVCAFLFASLTLLLNFIFHSPGRYLLNSLDLDASPCDDFYKFACGSYLKDHPIPLRVKSWSHFVKVFYEIRDKIKEKLNKNKKEFQADTNNSMVFSKLHDFFHGCLDKGKRRS